MASKSLIYRKTLLKLVYRFSKVFEEVKGLYGKIDITSTVLFVTLTILCILITIIIMQSRKSVKS